MLTRSQNTLCNDWQVPGTKIPFLSNRFYHVMAQQLSTLLADNHIWSVLLTNLDNSHAVTTLYKGVKGSRAPWFDSSSKSQKYRCCRLLIMLCGQTFRNALFPSVTLWWFHQQMGSWDWERWAAGWSLPHPTQACACRGLVAGGGHTGHVGQWAASACSLCHWWGHVWARSNYICPEMGSHGSASKLLKHSQILELGNGSQGAWVDLHSKVYPDTGGGSTDKVNQQLQGIHVAVCSFPRPFQSLFATRHSCDFEIWPLGAIPKQRSLAFFTEHGRMSDGFDSCWVLPWSQPFEGRGQPPLSFPLCGYCDPSTTCTWSLLVFLPDYMCFIQHL